VYVSADTKQLLKHRTITTIRADLKLEERAKQYPSSGNFLFMCELHR
jgi:hypothetical protein